MKPGGISRRIPGGALWALALMFLPGFSCYDLGPEPEMGPTFEVSYLPVVSVEGDLEEIKTGPGFSIGGGLGTLRGGDVVLPEEFSKLASSVEVLEEFRRRWPRGYQMGGEFQDWAAGSSISLSRHNKDGDADDDKDVDYWRIRIGGGGAVNEKPKWLVLDASLGECIHFVDREKQNDILGFGLFAGLGLTAFPAKNFGIGIEGSAEAWWGEGAMIVYTYVLGAHLTFQF